MKLILVALLFSLAARAETKPAVRPGDGGLSSEAINQTIKERITFIQRCYSDELKKKKSLGSSKVKTKIVIADDGHVTSADAVASFGSHRVETCIENELRQLKFPKPAGGGTVEISYPFAFEASEAVR
jgi:outer membrane biosynthesis protein TonB